jgi:hypothetical protein
MTDGNQLRSGGNENARAVAGPGVPDARLTQSRVMQVKLAASFASSPVSTASWG